MPKSGAIFLCLGGLGISLSSYAQENKSSKTLPLREEPKIENLKKNLQEFTKSPHVFTSKEQKDYSYQIKTYLDTINKENEVEIFTSMVPCLPTLHKCKGNIKQIQGTGYNVKALWPGNQKCHLLLGGHHDTKYFKDFYFIGANDGGSSTALLLELARIFSAERKKSKEGCTLEIVFFDGEEALLPEWNDGQKLLQIKDNTYGSRAFAQKHEVRLKENKTFVFIIDMIGHQEQKLHLTSHSSLPFAKAFLKYEPKAFLSSIRIEDDHIPFFEKNIPVLHLIDWTNIKEWHTPKDNLSIISYEKIHSLTQSISTFALEFHQNLPQGENK